MLTIDEPEAHLHPLAQQWLAQRLGDLATDGLQIIITTHSPHFVDLSHPENLALISKPNEGSTQVMQMSRPQLSEKLITLGADAERTTESSVGDFYSASATADILSALFARVVVLVEGQTESLALPVLLTSFGLDVLREGIAVVPVGGVGNISKWARFFKSYEIPVYCVFDTDSNKSGRDAIKLKAQREDIVRVMREDSDPSGNAPSLEPLNVEPGFATFDSHFETAISALLGATWDQEYSAASSIVGESKPLRARYAARNLNHDAPDCPELKNLAAAIKGLTGSSDPSGEPVGSVVESSAPNGWGDVPPS